MKKIEFGDYTTLAKYYHYRPAYSSEILDIILKYCDYNDKNFIIADIGAGTGKLTKMFLEKNIQVNAVEPNIEMLQEGKNYTYGFNVEWIQAKAEDTTLLKNTYNLITMASSFHWTNPEKSLPEFHRILKKNGHLLIMWNPRDLESSDFQKKIEQMIYEIKPNIQRISSGSKKHSKNWQEVITSTGHFKNVVYLESKHTEIMSKERYLGVWKSVNDIRIQLGEEKFNFFLNKLDQEISSIDEIVVPYLTRAWIAQRVD